MMPWDEPEDSDGRYDDAHVEALIEQRRMERKNLD